MECNKDAWQMQKGDLCKLSARLDLKATPVSETGTGSGVLSEGLRVKKSENGRYVSATFLLSLSQRASV